MSDGNQETGEFVTVERYRDLSEAIVAHSLLESAGIASWIRDENVARMEWQYSNLLGGIRLQVEAQDEDAAHDVLQQPIPGTIAFGKDEDFAQPQCPACGSIDITYEGQARGAALLGVSLLSVPLPRGGTSWTCHACGVRWRNTEDEAREPGSSTTPGRRDDRRNSKEGFLLGALPILASVGLLYVASLEGYGRVVHVSAALLSGAALWLGWRRMTASLVTRWVGNFLAICTAFFVVLGAFGFGVAFAWAGMPVLGVLVIGILYDLFVWQPHKGRFARARAERRGMPE
jgi:hypothetical protein